MQKIARTFTSVNRSCDLPESTSVRQSRLADANTRLLALREQIARSKTEVNSQNESSNLSLPTHLGWGSRRLLHSLGEPNGRANSAENSPIPRPAILEATSEEPEKQHLTSITLYPKLAAAFLKNEQAATARIWLLLRQIDVMGCGWVAIDDAKQQLTNKDVGLRVCGWRQLRNLLRAGNGIFWERDRDRIWLRSVAKVAHQLEVDRLHRPIVVPIKTLLSKIKTVRATFFAIGHSQRTNPISRAKLAEITGVNERTQRRYDQVAHIQKTANYCLGIPSDNPQQAAWHQRHAAFDFIDKQGKHGPAGKQYRAFQLPNSYTVNYQAAANGRTRKINQQLRQDLVKNRAQGNSRCQIEDNRVFGRKLFFDKGNEVCKQQGDTYLKIDGDPRQTFWVHFE